MAAAKRNALLNLLDTGRNVLVLLDPRYPGTQVPKQFHRDAALTLVLGTGSELVKPIPDLDVAEDGIGASLSFGGRLHWCFLPWEAVFKLESHLGSIVWPEDVPPEMRAAAAAVADRTAAAPAAAPTPIGARVISLDAHRTPKDRRACERRFAARSKLTAPTGANPEGGAA